MAPGLCIITTGDMHHEDALQGGPCDRYFSVFFYSTTVAMSIMYALDAAVLRFDWR
jgi:hypothetical protein